MSMADAGSSQAVEARTLQQEIIREIQELRSVVLRLSAAVDGLIDKQSNSDSQATLEHQIKRWLEEKFFTILAFPPHPSKAALRALLERLPEFWAKHPCW